MYLVWADCRFGSECTSNGIVLVTSADGVTWSPPRYVPIGAPSAPVHRFVPGLAVDPATRRKARLAVAAYISKAQGLRRLRDDRPLPGHLGERRPDLAPPVAAQHLVDVDALDRGDVARADARRLHLGVVRGGAPGARAQLCSSPVFGSCFSLTIFAGTAIPR